MFSLLGLVHLRNIDDVGAVGAALSGLGAAVAPVMEGAFNGGDLAAHFTFAAEADYRAAQPAIEAVLTSPGVARADTAFFGHGGGHAAAPGLSTGVWRGLLLAADRPGAAAHLNRFAFEMQLMPQYIPAIRNWRFSPVIEAGGALAWTHIWEQEFETVAGLTGPYMLHPYHWAHIDRWFDPECPDWIVNPRLCHSFCAFGRPVLG